MHLRMQFLQCLLDMTGACVYALHSSSSCMHKTFPRSTSTWGGQGSWAEELLTVDVFLGKENQFSLRVQPLVCSACFSTWLHTHEYMGSTIEPVGYKREKKGPKVKRSGNKGIWEVGYMWIISKSIVCMHRILNIFIYTYIYVHTYIHIRKSCEGK